MTYKLKHGKLVVEATTIKRERTTLQSVKNRCGELKAYFKGLEVIDNNLLPFNV